MESFKVIGDLYNRLFLVQTSNPDVLVDYVVWNKIKTSLPKDYRLPDAPFVETFSKALIKE
ncbi:hypothetical protein ACFQZT_08805 [Paenibacillus sp. GCM10027628]|uniref:hypothetical protein n=1 Tax=Paenibacillus sp. GCM10027628 TaxID=3273413 RepID=UPI00362500B4